MIFRQVPEYLNMLNNAVSWTRHFAQSPATQQRMDPLMLLPKLTKPTHGAISE